MKAEQGVALQGLGSSGMLRKLQQSDDRVAGTQVSLLAFCQLRVGTVVLVPKLFHIVWGVFEPRYGRRGLYVCWGGDKESVFVRKMKPNLHLILDNGSKNNSI